MSSHFITNEPDRNLSTIIHGILPKTKAMDFLVGYFYFSGIEEFAQDAKEKIIRILVGKEVDRELLKLLPKPTTFDNPQPSNLEQRERYYQSLVDIFSQSEYFENKHNVDSFHIYVDKLKNGTLEIRKTKDSCHAKMYIFKFDELHNEDGEMPGSVITGSSNLTYNGLRGQQEVNVRFNTIPEFEDAQKIFDSLWETATPLVNSQTYEEFEHKVLKKIWLDNIPSPFTVFLRVLDEYFNLDRSKRILTPQDASSRFQNLKYQEDAVRMALSAIEKHNGVIVADVVGLGKSIIASCIAQNLHLETIIIAPPHLKPQWEDYSSEFRLGAHVFSSGKIEDALEHFKNSSHHSDHWLIIIDEAHNYRNEYTQDYAMLHELCQDNKVVLLTATPFNNTPSDIYSMVKLFQYPTKTTLQTVNNLGKAFTELITQYKKLKDQQKKNQISEAEVKQKINFISNEIRKIIEPLVIRRSRLDLQKIPEYADDLKLQKIEFPEVQPPKLLDYKLGKLSKLYIDTLERISPNGIDGLTYTGQSVEDDSDPVSQLPANCFTAARYQPITYVKSSKKKDVEKLIEKAGYEYHLFQSAQTNLAKFMRTLLVRRFESSQRAFKISLEHMLQYCQNIQNWTNRRQTVPIFKKGQLPDIDSYYASMGDQGNSLEDTDFEDKLKRFQEKGLFEIPTDCLEQRFFDDLDRDIQLLKSLQHDWDKYTEDDDPKWQQFIEILEKDLKREPNRKIVVFSQFADTVNYLYEKLSQRGLPVFAYTSQCATQENKKIIRTNFDAGIPKSEQCNDYKILIATDAISEGYNLHRAGAIINYDIPYNPTRVIQRVGRINRINKKVFEKLFIYNYFPTAIGESETRTKEISTLKMAMIHTLMGEDTKILTSDEQLQSFFAQQYKRIFANEEQESWYVKYLAMYNQYRNLEEMKNAEQLPARTKLRRVSTTDKGVLLFVTQGNDYVFKFATQANDCQTISPETALNLFEAQQDEKGFAVTEHFDELFTALKASLKTSIRNRDVDKAKREAFEKVKSMLNNTENSDSDRKDYLTRLKEVIQNDALSGYDLRFINQLSPSDFTKLEKKISLDYIDRIHHGFDNIGFRGYTNLIVAEEFGEGECQ